MSKKIITIDEILLRLSPPNHSKLFKAKYFEVFYGRTEADVVALFALFGNDAKFITSALGNEMENSALSELRSNNVEPITIKQGNRLGVYFRKMFMLP